ncbi:MAG: RnfABCDGE type electron transport complex subunit G [Candidatus Neomarinimicrobiota bacterium]
MNTSTKMIVVLTIIAALSGSVLSMWDGVTAPRIEANRLKVLKQAISRVLPAYERYDEVQVREDITLYVGKDAADNTVGVAFKAKGNGFSPDLTLMVGITPNFGELTGIEVLEQTETPGLGNKIEEDWFKGQFKGLITDAQKAQVVKNVKPADPTRGIQAISGATISSKAVVDIIWKQIAVVRELYQVKVAGI